MSTKVIIFGASEGGKKVRQRLPKNINVIAFSDNDPNKHGTTIDKIPVVEPEQLLKLNFDYIIIGSMYELEISRQLKLMGIDESKIESGWHLSIGTPSSFPWDAIFFLLLILTVGITALFSLFKFLE